MAPPRLKMRRLMRKAVWANTALLIAGSWLLGSEFGWKVGLGIACLGEALLFTLEATVVKYEDEE